MSAAIRCREEDFPEVDDSVVALDERSALVGVALR
jgi:hypothetical protein